MEILMVILGMILVFSMIHFIRKDPADINHEDDQTETEPEVDYDKIKNISGKYYYEDDHFTSSFGIDVSEFQKDINWKEVKNDDVEFVYMRLGRRGATTGLLYMDDKFEEYYKGAKECGIKIGVYFFSQAINEEEAIEEAHFVLDALKDKQIDLPIAYDLEEVFLDEGLVPRTLTLKKEELTRNAIVFMEEIKKAGYECIVYTYPYWLQNFYDIELLKDYPLWYAQYNYIRPEIDAPLYMWQYTNEGKIKGIEGYTDLNIMFCKKEKN